MTPTMMLSQETQVINTLRSPKSLDCMYKTRYTRLSYVLMVINHFLDLLQPNSQTHDLNKYTYSKHKGKDTHKVS